MKVIENEEFMKLWDWDCNTLDPKILAISSSETVNLYCKKCKQKYSMITRNIFRSKTIKCKYCSGRTFKNGVNDLVTLKFNFIREWDYEKNLLNPSEIGVGYKEKIWWKCSLGHNWQAFVYNRIKRGDSCPYCSGKRLLKDFNTLNITHNEIINEWNYDLNNVFPNEVTFGMALKVYWNCNKHGVYFKAINKRVGGQNCPKCSNSISTGENELLNYIKSIYKDEIITNEREILDGKELDIYLPRIKLALEYNGDYWHSSKSIRFKNESDAYEFHENKYMNSLNKNVILLNIWENDWSKNKEFLKEQLFIAINNNIYSPVFFKFNSSKF